MNHFVSEFSSQIELDDIKKTTKSSSLYATCVSANAVIKAYRDKMHNPKTPSPINSKDFDSVVTIPELYRNYSDRTDTVRLETVTGRNTDLDNDPPRGTYKYKYWTQHLNSGGTIQRCSKIPLNREEKAEWVKRLRQDGQSHASHQNAGACSSLKI